MTAWGDVKMMSGAEYAALVAEKDNLRAALTKIACFDDEYANKYLRSHGSYAGFDEPASVKIARAALKGESHD